MTTQTPEAAPHAGMTDTCGTINLPAESQDGGAASLICSVCHSPRRLDPTGRHCTVCGAAVNSEGRFSLFTVYGDVPLTYDDLPERQANALAEQMREAGFPVELKSA